MQCCSHWTLPESEMPLEPAVHCNKTSIVSCLQHSANGDGTGDLTFYNPSSLSLELPASSFHSLIESLTLISHLPPSSNPADPSPLCCNDVRLGCLKSLITSCWNANLHWTPFLLKCHWHHSTLSLFFFSSVRAILIVNISRSTMFPCYFLHTKSIWIQLACIIC